MTLREKINNILYDARQDDRFPEKYLWIEKHGSKSVSDAILSVVEDDYPLDGLLSNDTPEWKSKESCIMGKMCIRQTHAEKTNKTWCERSIGMEWAFENIDHAVYSNISGSISTICKKCLNKIIKILKVE